MGKFDGWLLVSDFDGTLIDDQGCVPQDNIAAIQYFASEGGLFCGATGRTELLVRPFMTGLPMETPWILYNGGAIFDFAWNTFKWRDKINRAVLQPFIAEVLRCFPQANVQVHAGGPFYETNLANPADPDVGNEKQEYILCPLEEVPDGWIKILFGCDDPRVLVQIDAMYKASPAASVTHNTYSGHRYYEILPRNASKGAALRQLKMLLHPCPHTVVAIGDYLNDLELLQEADIAACPENAHPDIKAAASIITCHHAHCAVADLVQKFLA